MPAVTAIPVTMGDGTVVTSFTDSVGPSSVMYTYPITNDLINISNTGFSNLTVNVGASIDTIPPGETRTITSSFNVITIKSSSGICSFHARAVCDKNKDYVESIGKPHSKAALLYMRAVEDISQRITRDALTRARSQIKSSGTLRIAFIGDSITEEMDQIIAKPSDGYPSRLTAMLKQAMPNVSITMGNFGLAGREIWQYVSSSYVGMASPEVIGTGFYRAAPWGDGGGSVIGKSWSDHVKDFAPDLVVIAYGMNGPGFDVASNVDEAFKINLKSIIDSLATWASNPSVVVVPVFLPTTDTSLYSQGLLKTNAVARAAREYGYERKVAVADVNRLYRILRDGVDEELRYFEQEKNFDNWSESGAWVSNGYTVSGALATASTSGTPSIQRKRSFYNGFLEFEVYIPGYGAPYAQWIDLRKNAKTGERITYIVTPNSASGVTDGSILMYTSDSGSSIALTTNMDIPINTWLKLRFEAVGPYHKVYLNGTLRLSTTNYKKLIEGEVRVTAVNTNGGASLRNMVIGYYEPTKCGPIFDELELLGSYNTYLSGNAINHPSGLGHALYYLPAFYGVVESLSSVENKTDASADQPQYAYGPIKMTGTGQFLWATPVSGVYPLTTTSGDKIWYTVYAADPTGSNTLTQFRKTDTGEYLTRNMTITSDGTKANLVNLVPGQYARYDNLLFIAYPTASGTPPLTYEIWQHMTPAKVP
ncbi:GDSL-type esterase/lipase family protein [Gorillibacterium sp. sgz5001074]|uniref:GDSL-type esterase/lipase family protein n=1 Tax=Gorillibacterium sp. sgz5001074 TaxID=3446695 RepID=UPI003F66996B